MRYGGQDSFGGGRDNDVQGASVVCIGCCVSFELESLEGVTTVWRQPHRHDFFMQLTPEVTARIKPCKAARCESVAATLPCRRRLPAPQEPPQLALLHSPPPA